MSAPRHRLSVVRRIMDASYPLLLLMWVFTVLAFGVLYYALVIRFPAHAPSLPDGLTPLELFLDCIYFSVITAMTVGYGDIVPMGASKLLAALEAFLAYFVMTMLISKMLSGRQEAALARVHRMSLHDAYHRVREGLYLFRRDCETVTDSVERSGVLSTRMAGILATAFAELQNVLGNIAELYDHHLTNTILDTKHEQVLIEAVRRTLERLRDLQAILQSKDIRLADHLAVLREYDEVLTMARLTIRRWQTASPHHSGRQFAELKRTMATMQKEPRVRRSRA